MPQPGGRLGTGLASSVWVVCNSVAGSTAGAGPPRLAAASAPLRTAVQAAVQAGAHAEVQVEGSGAGAKLLAAAWASLVSGASGVAAAPLAAAPTAGMAP